jgi:uncharacterized protein (TIGR03382 family)
MTLRTTRALLVAGLLVVTTTAALAFVPSGFRWRLPVPYQVNTASSQELGRDATLASINASYANWMNPQCSGFSAEFRGETNSSYRVGDGMNTLIWFYNPNERPREIGGQATIGVTLSLFSGNNASDGDILFNGIDHRWTTNAVNRGQVDAISIITHETGHQLGLNHSPFQSATMYAAYLGGNGAASLDADDINGVCDLYPSGAQAECQADDDCPQGQRCLGGACVDQEQAGGGAIGDPCGQNVGCGDGMFCARDQSGNSFCTRECGGGCPAGWICQPVQINNRQANICLPGDEEPNEPGRAYGEACQNSAQCASGFCIGNESGAFCSQACSGPQDCPPGSDCFQVQGGGGACVPGDDPAPVDAAVPPPVQDQFVPPVMADSGGGTPPNQRVDGGVSFGDPADPFARDGQVGNGGGAPSGQPGSEITVRVSKGDSGGCQSSEGTPFAWLLLVVGSWGLLRRRFTV